MVDPEPPWVPGRTHPGPLLGLSAVPLEPSARACPLCCPRGVADAGGAADGDRLLPLSAVTAGGEGSCPLAGAGGVCRSAQRPCPGNGVPRSSRCILSGRAEE